MAEQQQEEEWSEEVDEGWGGLHDQQEQRREEVEEEMVVVVDEEEEEEEEEHCQANYQDAREEEEEVEVVATHDDDKPWHGVGEARGAYDAAVELGVRRGLESVDDDKETVRLTAEALLMENNGAVSWESGEMLEGLLRTGRDTGRGRRSGGWGARWMGFKALPRLVGGAAAKGTEALGNARRGVKEYHARHGAEYTEIAKSASAAGLGLLCCVVAAKVLSVAGHAAGRAAMRVTRHWGAADRDARAAAIAGMENAHRGADRAQAVAGPGTVVEVPRPVVEVASVGCQADLGGTDLSPMTPSLGPRGFWRRRASVEQRTPVQVAPTATADQVVATLLGAKTLSAKSTKGESWGGWSRRSPADVFGFPGTPESVECESEEDGSVEDDGMDKCDPVDLLKDTRRNLNQVLSDELLSANTTRVGGMELVAGLRAT